MKKTVFCVICTLALIAGSFIYQNKKTLSSEIKVETVLPESVTMRDYVTLRGSVAERERYQIFIQNSVKTVNVFVSEGENVKRGDLLMTATKEEALTASGMIESIKNAVKDTLNESVSTAALEAKTEEKNGVLNIFSPCSGTVMSISSANGALIFSGTPCAVISDTEKLEVTAQADESVISDIKKGNECTIRVKALSGDTFEGRVTKIMPYAKSAFSLSGKGEKGTEITVSLPQSNGLKPGYTALVNVVTDVRENALLLPFEAIGQDDSNKEYVFVFFEGKAEKRFIETGKELSEKCEIISGISEKDKVILHPESIPDECVVLK